MYVLGDTFIRNFYASFNYEKNTVGLAQSAYAPRGTSVETLDESDMAPRQPDGSDNSTGLSPTMIIGTTMLCMMVFVMIGLVIRAQSNKRKQKQVTLANIVDGQMRADGWAEPLSQAENTTTHNEYLS